MSTQSTADGIRALRLALIAGPVVCARPMRMAADILAGLAAAPLDLPAAFCGSVEQTYCAFNRGLALPQFVKMPRACNLA